MLSIRQMAYAKEALIPALVQAGTLPVMVRLLRPQLQGKGPQAAACLGAAGSAAAETLSLAMPGFWTEAVAAGAVEALLLALLVPATAAPLPAAGPSVVQPATQSAAAALHALAEQVQSQLGSGAAGDVAYQAVVGLQALAQIQPGTMQAFSNGTAIPVALYIDTVALLLVQVGRGRPDAVGSCSQPGRIAVALNQYGSPTAHLAEGWTAARRRWWSCCRSSRRPRGCCRGASAGRACSRRWWQRSPGWRAP
jgi:hypothetical protein